MRRLSLDPGARRVGLAWSDGECEIALPLKTLDARDKGLVPQLCAEIAELGAEEVVIGLPLMLDGTESEGARRSRQLAAKLEAATEAAGTPVRVVLWDERLTTASAQRSLRGAGVSARDQKDKIDQVAATILLQSYLDANTERSWDEELLLPDVPKPGARRRRNSRDR